MLLAGKMGSVFEAEELCATTFRERLQPVLDRAREALGLRRALVLELAAVEGRVAPWLRGSTPRNQTFGALSLEAFGSLRDAATALPAALRELSPDFDAERALVVPLALRPRFARDADALLLLEWERQRPNASLLSELTQCLERGLSEDRRQRLSESLLNAVEQAPDAIELTDREARLMYANPAWERFFHYALPDVVGHTVGSLFRDPVAPLHDPAFYQFTLAALHAGKSWLGVLACRAGNDERRWCEVNVSPFDAPSQGLHGNFAIRRDIAHRAERDTALAVAHHEFRAVLSAIPDGVAVLRDGLIYFANRAFLTTVRSNEAAVIGRPYADFIHPDDRAHFEQEHRQRVVRVRLVLPEGPPRFVEISTAGEVSFEARPAMILLSRDITDYRLAQEQLARAEKLSALGSLAASVAHEINNPLAYVVVNLELARSATRDIPAAEGEALEEAIDGVRRIRQIVAELRGFSGSDGPGPAEPVDVHKAMTSALNIVQNEIRHRARLERVQDRPLYALAREGQLVQVFVNVLTNAAQAIPSSSDREHLIRVHSQSTAEGRLRISISDSGCGIAEGALAHVFEPFYTGKRRGKGSGLGLPISKRIIDAFGGRMYIESALGRGTTVHIELCEAEASTRLETRSTRSRDADRRGVARARILVVDDERPLARTLRRLLSNHEVVLAYDGSSAYDILQGDARFDVILCDLMMPGLSGADLYHRVSEHWPELEARFIFMTGGSMSELGDAFIESVRARLLTKPFDPERMLEWVEEAARRAAVSFR